MYEIIKKSLENKLNRMCTLYNLSKTSFPSRTSAHREEIKQKILKTESTIKIYACDLTERVDAKTKLIEIVPNIRDLTTDGINVLSKAMCEKDLVYKPYALVLGTEVISSNVKTNEVLQNTVKNPLIVGYMSVHEQTPGQYIQDDLEIYEKVVSDIRYGSDYSISTETKPEQYAKEYCPEILDEISELDAQIKTPNHDGSIPSYLEPFTSHTDFTGGE